MSNSSIRTKSIRWWADGTHLVDADRQKAGRRTVGRATTVGCGGATPAAPALIVATPAIGWSSVNASSRSRAGALQQRRSKLRASSGMQAGMSPARGKRNARPQQHREPANTAPGPGMKPGNAAHRSERACRQAPDRAAPSARSQLHSRHTQHSGSNQDDAQELLRADHGQNSRQQTELAGSTPRLRTTYNARTPHRARTQARTTSVLGEAATGAA